MQLKQKTAQANEISEKYKFQLIKKWTGYKAFWHAWHQPNLIHILTYENYIDRIIEIEQCKPQNEKKERYLLMKPVADAAWVKASAAWVKANAARDKADAAWVKASAAREKAYAPWEKADAPWEKAYAAWVKASAAWVKANAAWVKKNHIKIKAAHVKECPGCKWDGSRLPQFD